MQTLDISAPFQRRSILQAAAAALSMAGLGFGHGEARAAARTTSRQAEGGGGLAYVGTYGPKGQGIYRFGLDTGTGMLRPAGLAAATPNPTWLAFDATQRFLYAVNEVANVKGSGSVSAFAVHVPSGELTLLNTVSSEGAGPVHLSVHPGGKFVLVANYVAGSVAVLPIAADGSLLPASAVQSDASACGATKCAPGVDGAAKAPPGSFARSDHNGAHAHMIASDPSGRFVIVNDLGLDRTITWRFDPQSGSLSQPTTVTSSPGAGPRHFVFHPNGRWFYSLNEEASTLAFMVYDTASGRFTPQDELSTLPPGFAGTSFASEILLSPDGRTLYGLNRLHDSIALFAIGEDGRPTWVGEEWTRGSYPRSAAIGPGGRFMYVCNQRSDHVAIFRIGQGGKLAFTDQYVDVGAPAVIAFTGT